MEKQFVFEPIVVLIGGKAGTGKTEASLLLSSIVDSLGALDFVTMNFAFGVKQTAKECFFWDGKKDDRGRKLLQDIGGIGRAYYQDIWAMQVGERILSNPCLFDFVFIDDWRFPNEERCINRQLNSRYKVRTLYLSAPERELLKGTPAYKDLSETSLDNYKKEDFDFYIENTGDLNDLRKKLKEVIESILLETNGGTK